ncbi:MAG: VOC family protein [Defluviitaleaceae bacterium]|nr:VOC family protein [Defluviitaleaceae bacterium]
MTKVSPFLTFSGTCGEAIALYTKALNAKITFKSHYSDTKDPKCQDESKKHYIYHAQLKIGKNIIMMCDDSSDKLSDGMELRQSEVCLCAEFATPNEVKAAYDIMSENATIIEPFSSASYSKSFVFLEDKFGIRWWLMTAE